MVSNRPYDVLSVDEMVTLHRTVSARDLVVFAHACGDANPLHRPDSDIDVDGDGASDAQAPAAWISALISASIGTALPGPGSLIRALHLDFSAPARVGDTLHVALSVKDKREARSIRLAIRVTRGDDALVCAGEADVIAPSTLIAQATALPGLLVGRESRLSKLIEACAPLPPLRTAVVAPDDEKSLAGALLGKERGLITPILVGDPERIAAAARGLGVTLADVEVIACLDRDSAAAAAVDLVNAGKAGAVMKGNLHTDEVLRHVVKSVGGLRRTRRISHCFVMDAPTLDQVLVISDAAIAIAPTLEEKVDITQNAIDLASAIGIAQPKVGVLSAVETVNPKIPSTLDAAALAKMAERGQIKGGVVDGPLAMDNALSLSAAQTKGIISRVAGHADVLIAPNIEAGNILVKELTYAAGAEGGGLVVGAKAPVMLTSRADDAQDRLVSCALAVLYAHWRTSGKSAVI